MDHEKGSSTTQPSFEDIIARMKGMVAETTRIQAIQRTEDGQVIVPAEVEAELASIATNTDYADDVKSLDSAATPLLSLSEMENAQNEENVDDASPVTSGEGNDDTNEQELWPIELHNDTLGIKVDPQTNKNGAQEGRKPGVVTKLVAAAGAIAVPFMLMLSGPGPKGEDEKNLPTTASQQIPSKDGKTKGVNLASPSCEQPVAEISGAMVGNIMIPIALKDSTAVMRVQTKGEDGKPAYPVIDSKLTADISFCVPKEEGVNQPIGVLSADGKTVTIDRSSFAFNTKIPTDVNCDRTKPDYACVSGISKSSYEAMKPILTKPSFDKILSIVVDGDDSAQKKRFATYSSMALVRQFTDYIDDVYSKKDFTNVLDGATKELMEKQAPGVAVVFENAYQNPKDDFRDANNELATTTFGWVEKATGAATITPINANTQNGTTIEAAKRGQK